MNRLGLLAECLGLVHRHEYKFEKFGTYGVWQCVEVYYTVRRGAVVIWLVAISIAITGVVL